MKTKNSVSSASQKNKTFFFIAGMILSSVVTNVVDHIFPPEPVVVHTVIDSVKIVHEYNHKRNHQPDRSIQTWPQNNKPR